jgi:hypothetical protein
MLSSPAFVNEVLDRDAGGQPVSLAKFTNMRDRFSGSLPRNLRGQRFSFTPGLDAFDDHFVNGMEVAILQLFLHQPFGFGFDVDRHGRTLPQPIQAVNSIIPRVLLVLFHPKRDLECLMEANVSQLPIGVGSRWSQAIFLKENEDFLREYRRCSSWLIAREKLVDKNAAPHRYLPAKNTAGIVVVPETDGRATAISLSSAVC